jgi:3alpha(or 20beta)-hydroxysteroid dehydrogenase
MARRDSIMGRVEDKIALVTGGARGMGEAIARRLHAEGAHVVVADLRVAEAEKIAGELEHASCHELDVTNESDWQRSVADVVAEHGRIDVLVNNAGVFGAGALSEMLLEEYRRVIDVNQVGVFLGMKSAARPMSEAGSGSIVNISSTAGLRAGSPGLIAYIASKWAVRAMTKAAAAELGPAGIRVNSVHPGPTDTPMLYESMGLVPEQLEAATSRIPLGRIGQPRDVANAVLFLASDEASYVNGIELAVDGGSIL